MSKSCWYSPGSGFALEIDFFTETLRSQSLIPSEESGNGPRESDLLLPIIP